MLKRLNKWFDKLSEFLAARKGLLILVGVLLVFLNLVLQFIAQPGWLISSNLFLHLGVIIALVGLLLAWAL
jgi:hypothetical protein